MTFSNTLGHNAEITGKFYHGNEVLEVRKTDIDTWLLVTYELRDGKEINKNAVTVNGEQMRAMIEHKYLFTKG